MSAKKMLNDIIDFRDAGGDMETLRERVENPVPVKPSSEVRQGAKIWKMSDVQAATYTPPGWLLPSILPRRGVTLFAAAPKLGKSFFALGLALGVAGNFEALEGATVGEHGPVLYIDTDRGAAWRTRERSRQLLAGKGVPDDAINSIPISFLYESPRFGEGAEELVRIWLNANPDAALVVVDILGNIRPQVDRKDSLYKQDYEAIFAFKKLVDDFPNVAFLVIHHTRKGRDGDPLEMLSGSNGLVAAADNVLVMLKERKGLVTLHVEGRDIRCADEFALTRNEQTGAWIFSGTAEAARLTEERQKIFDVLREGPSTGLRAGEICEALGCVTQQEKGRIRALLFKMKKDVLEFDIAQRYTIAPT